MSSALVIITYVTAVGLLVAWYVGRQARKRQQRYRFLARQRYDLEERVARCHGLLERLADLADREPGSGAGSDTQAAEARDYLRRVHPQMQELEKRDIHDALLEALTVDSEDLKEVRIELETLRLG
jgi:hypothetical protein